MNNLILENFSETYVFQYMKLLTKHEIDDDNCND